MMNENQLATVAYFESMIDDIKHGVLEITSLGQERDWIEHFIEDGRCNKVIDGRFLTGSGTITLRYRALPTPKVMLSQKEVFETIKKAELVRLNADEDAMCYDLNTLIIKSNIYASANTVKVWKEQYE